MCVYLYFQERSTLNSLLATTEDWLYDEGEDQTKQVYVDKLAELKVPQNINHSFVMLAELKVPQHINHSFVVALAELKVPYC